MHIFNALLHIAILAAAAFLVRRQQTQLRFLFWPALLFRVFCGIAVGLVYTWYYAAADTFQYFHDAEQMAAVAFRDPAAWINLLFFNEGVGDLALGYTEPRAMFLSRLTSVFTIITLGNYWITALYFSFASFIAAWFLTTTLSRLLPSVKVPAIAAILFLPSVVFWTSGLLKETLAVASLYFLVAVFLKYWFGDRIRLWQYVTVAVALWVLWNLKYYYAGIFVPVALTSILYRYVRWKWGPFRPLPEVVIWLGVFVLPVIVVSFIHPNFNLHRVLEVIVQNNHAYNAISAPEDVIHYHGLTSTLPGFLQNAPWAWFSGLFRPFIWESQSLLQVMAAFENTVVLILCAVACLRFRRPDSPDTRILLLSTLAYVSMLSILLALSAPNFGTLSRYKAGYLSFFVLVILCNHPFVARIERSLRRLVSH